MTTTLANAAMFLSIWLATVLFAAGEIGKRSAGARQPAAWALPLWITGALLCAVHMLLAIGWHHGWHHDAAVRATAQQTEAVFGIAWGGGVYVNYVFLILWAGEAFWWWNDPRRYFSRPAWMVLATRALYFVILVNAAVIFVPNARRVAGLAIIACLLWAWRPPRESRSDPQREAVRAEPQGRR